jgi:hypothetical protein
MQETVRNILWWHYFGEKEMRILLSICTGVQNLALKSLTPSMLPLLESLQLRRLTLPLSSHLNQISTTKTFTTLTHLHIHFVHDGGQWTWIGTLPSLTHLCISNPVHDDRQFVDVLLRRIKKLQVLVCTFSLGVLLLSDHWVDDPRVVFLRLNHDYVRDWKSGAAGGRDFWVRAEEFLALKLIDTSISSSSVFLPI